MHLYSVEETQGLLTSNDSLAFGIVFWLDQGEVVKAHYSQSVGNTQLSVSGEMLRVAMMLGKRLAKSNSITFA